ncbi:MAG: topoisomerase [Candidatus Nitrosopolaris wilkensis]|nr:MAG: topoisomerase [Candidatus Nitrosopolaris wilkensis]
MRYKVIDDNIVYRLRGFISMLNEESENGSVIVVEGKRDARALASVGFNGSLIVFSRFKGVADFVDNHCEFGKKIILLLDMDRTGKHLTSKLLKSLQFNGNNVNLFYKSALARICNGKIRHVEDLVAYAPYFAGITGNRKDLYFYM